MIGRTNAAVGTVKNPYIAKSESEMAKYRDAKYAGAFVKFLDPAYENFTVPVTYQYGIRGNSGSNLDYYIGFIFDNRKDIKEVENILDKFITVENELITITTMTYVNGKNETQTVKIYGCKNGTSKAIYAEYPRNSSIDRYLMWHNGITDLNDSILSFYIDQGETWAEILANWDDNDKQLQLNYLKENIGWIDFPDKETYQKDSYGGISMLILTLLWYNENRNLTITQMLSGAERLYVMEGLSSIYQDGQVYQVSQSGVITKYNAESPLSVGDTFANGSFNLNTNLSEDEVIALLEQIPWDQGYIIDNYYFYYNILNNDPDYGYSTYTGTDFENTEQFGKGLMGISLFKGNLDDLGVVYGIASYGYNNGDKVWLWTCSKPFDWGVDEYGWQVSSATFAHDLGADPAQDATITRINNQNIINQLFSKTNFTSLGTVPSYSLEQYNIDGKITCIGKPLGSLLKSTGAEMIDILSHSKNYGKLYKYTGYSTSDYTMNNYYIVEDK